MSDLPPVEPVQEPLPPSEKATMKGSDVGAVEYPQVTATPAATVVEPPAKKKLPWWAIVLIVLVVLCCCCTIAVVIAALSGAFGEIDLEDYMHLLPLAAAYL